MPLVVDRYEDALHIAEFERPHDRTATSYADSIAQITWFMPGDDGWWGNATYIEVRKSDQLINSENWDEAEPVSGLPDAGERGEPMEMYAYALSPGTTYHFATRAGDDAGFLSPLSVSASVTTLPIIHLHDPTVSPENDAPGEIFTFEILYSYSEPAQTHELTVTNDEDVSTTYVLDLIESTPLGDRYGIGITISEDDLGLHSHEYRFTAPGSPEVTTGQINGPLVGVIFTMGSPDSELGRDNDESLHKVGLPGLAIAEQYEVTQAEWKTHMGTDPPDEILNRPVDGVEWLDAIRYCNRRSAFEGYDDPLPYSPAEPMTVQEVTWNRESQGYRLPTEAEWEYFCRAGSESAFYAGGITALVCEYDPILDTIGWYCGNAGSGTHDVGGKAANDSSLYDMSGNVKEWCWDWYQEELGTEQVYDPIGPDSGLFKVVRGGSWFYASRDCRSAARDFRVPDTTDDTIGFRVVRTVPVN